MVTLLALGSWKRRLMLWLVMSWVSLTANGQVHSVVVDHVLYAGRADSQIVVTNTTNPDIATLESYLQDLPSAGMPNWPPFGPRGFLLENNNVQDFPQEVRVFQGVIRTFSNHQFQYFHDVHGLESFLTNLFGSPLSRKRGPPANQQALSGWPQTIGPLLPTNGYEPPYNPKVWNDDGVVQHQNNDYNYSTNKRTDTFAQPGRAHGHTVQGPPFTCSGVLASAIADGLIPWPADVPCSSYDYKIAFLANPDPDPTKGDYNSYRQDRGGNWSYKAGRTEAVNVDKDRKPITDPRTSNNGDYKFCAFMCVLANPNLVNIR